VVVNCEAVFVEESSDGGGEWPFPPSLRRGIDDVNDIAKHDGIVIDEREEAGIF